jgi:hypothetical protein
MKIDRMTIDRIAKLVLVFGEDKRKLSYFAAAVNPLLAA